MKPKSESQSLKGFHFLSDDKSPTHDTTKRENDFLIFISIFKRKTSCGKNWNSEEKKNSIKKKLCVDKSIS